MLSTELTEREWSFDVAIMTGVQCQALEEMESGSAEGFVHLGIQYLVLSLSQCGL